MKVLDMVHKVCRIGVRRLHMNDGIYSILKPVSKHRITKSFSEAEKVLGNFHANPNNSALTQNHITESSFDLQVIVPAYNVEPYIAECIDSILEQKTKYTYKIIIINDGSTDHTERILDNYRSSDHVEIINQQNKGLSGARNTGLQNICAKYIMFVDSDDKLASGAIDSLLDCAFEHDCDIVEGGYYKFYNTKTVGKVSRKFQICAPSANTLSGFAWGKVFKACLFEHIHFPEEYWFEDTINTFLLYPLCTKIATIENYVYYYRYNPASISHTYKNNPKCLDTVWILQQILADRRQLAVAMDQNIFNKIMGQICINYYRTKDLPENIRKSVFIYTKNLLQTNLKKFKTNPSPYSDLQNAIENGDYGTYCLFCNWKSTY